MWLGGANSHMALPSADNMKPSHEDRVRGISGAACERGEGGCDASTPCFSASPDNPRLFHRPARVSQRRGRWVNLRRRPLPSATALVAPGGC
jgi:hypothetical protein